MPEKLPDETLTVTLDWSARVTAPATIETSEWLLPAALTATSPAVNGAQTSVQLSGGEPGTQYTILNRVTLSDAAVLSREALIVVTADAAEAVTTPADIRDLYLPGLRMEDSQGRPLPDKVFLARIASAVSAFERRYGVRLRPTAIKVGPYNLRGELQAGDVLVDDPTRYTPMLVRGIETFQGIDYHVDGGMDNRHYSLKLPVGPIRRVHKFGLFMPGMREPTPFPVDWAQFTRKTNRVTVYPGKDMQFSILMTTQVYANLLPGGRSVPQAWHFSYVAGYSKQDLLTTDRDVWDALNKLTAIEVLAPGSLDRNMAFGIVSKSVGVDGLSQNASLVASANDLKYANIIKRYQDELATWERTFWARKGGIRLGSL